MSEESKFQKISRQLKELWVSSYYEAELGKRNRFEVLWDIANCRRRYHMTMINYRTYGFAVLRDERIRNTYLGSFDLRYVEELCNDKKNAQYDIKDKLSAYHFYQDYFRRPVIDLRSASLEEFLAFAEKVPVFMAKELFNCGGYGIERIVVSEVASLPELYQRFLAQGKVLLEGVIEQHPDIEAIAPGSINTVRVTAIRDSEGVIHTLPTVMRMGDGTSFVDNASSGGMYVRINDEGVIDSEYAATEISNVPGKGNLIVYTEHPFTKRPFKGFVVPFYAEAIAMVKEMMAKDPALNLLGWDIAITPDGPCLVEVNNNPGYDMCQFYLHNAPGFEGIKPRVEKILNGRFTKTGFVLNR